MAEREKPKVFRISHHVEPDFGAVYDAWYDRVYSYAYTILLNREDAEDVTADAFLAVCARYDQYDPSRGSVGTWLLRVAHNRAVDLLRSPYRSRRAELPEDWESPDGGDLAEEVETSDTLLRLYRRLKPEERELLNLRCVLELKFREIGGLLGLPEKTVNQRYQRLLTQCRLILNSE